MRQGRRAKAFTVLAVLLGVFCSVAAASAQQPADAAGAILGEWYTKEGKARVQIARCGDFYCARILWLRAEEETGQPKLDAKNPDETLRSRPLLGLEIFSGAKYSGDATWSGARLYDPETGKTYKGRAKLDGNGKLNLRGYVLMPLFGRTETWVRAEP